MHVCNRTEFNYLTSDFFGFKVAFSVETFIGTVNVPIDDEDYVEWVVMMEEFAEDGSVKMDTI